MRIAVAYACGRILHACHQVYMGFIYIVRAIFVERAVRAHVITYTWGARLFDMGLLLADLEVRKDTAAISAMSKKGDTMNIISQTCDHAISGGVRSLYTPMRMISVAGIFPIVVQRGIRVRG